MTRIDIRGEGGQTIKDKWADGPRNYLGLQTAGFPNFFIAINAAFCNYTVCAESIVEWITDCIRYMREKGFKRIAPTPQAEDAWIEYINELAAGSIFTKAKSAGLWGRIFLGRPALSSSIPSPLRPIGPSVRRPQPRAMRGLCCSKEAVGARCNVPLLFASEDAKVAAVDINRRIRPLQQRSLLKYSRFM